MEKNIPLRKILVGVDGSDQSMEAVRYAGRIFSPQHTRIVLFNVRYQLMELFSDLEDYPHYKSRVTHVKKWATEQKAEICSFMNQACQILKNAGFDDERITVKIPSKTLGVTTDIIKESYSEYSAVVVGRTGLSRFKDWLMKSSAVKLVAKIKHIPIIIVGGTPDIKKLLIAFDGSRGAMRAVSWAGILLNGSKTDLRLYSMITKDEKFWDTEKESFLCDNNSRTVQTMDNDFCKQYLEAHHLLVEEGVMPEQISAKFHVFESRKAEQIVDEATHTHFGSIVVGRRGFVSFIEAFFIGRVSQKVLNMADKLALWVI